MGSEMCIRDRFDEALASDPSHIRARLNRCSALMAMGEGRKVLDDAEILLDLAPSLTLARLRRAEGFMLLTENLYGQRRNQGLYIYISPNSFSARVGPLSKACASVRFYKVSLAKWVFPISDPRKHVTLASSCH